MAPCKIVGVVRSHGLGLWAATAAFRAARYAWIAGCNTRVLQIPKGETSNPECIAPRLVAAATATSPPSSHHTRDENPRVPPECPQLAPSLVMERNIPAQYWLLFPPRLADWSHFEPLPLPSS